MYLTILEYAAFISSLISLWAYGSYPKYGPLVGILCASLFIIWGSLAPAYSAVIVNAIFLALHLYNADVNRRKQNDKSPH